MWLEVIPKALSCGGTTRVNPKLIPYALPFLVTAFGGRYHVTSLQGGHSSQLEQKTYTVYLVKNLSVQSDSTFIILV